MVEPSESTFNHAAPWENNKALLVIGAEDNRKTETTMLCDPVTKRRSAIATIAPKAKQLLTGTRQPLEEELGAVTFLHASGGHDHNQE
jgi:hypothetical protein